MKKLSFILASVWVIHKNFDVCTMIWCWEIIFQTWTSPRGVHPEYNSALSVKYYLVFATDLKDVFRASASDIRKHLNEIIAIPPLSENSSQFSHNPKTVPSPAYSSCRAGLACPSLIKLSGRPTEAFNKWRRYRRGKTANDSVYRITYFSLKAMERRMKIYIIRHFDVKT